MRSDDWFAIIFTAVLIAGLTLFIWSVTNLKPPHFSERPTPVMDAVVKEALRP